VGTAGAHPELGQAKRLVRGVPLRLLQADLELSAAARRLLLQQLGHGHAERGGKLLDKRQPRLALAVLDQREHRRRAADFRTENRPGSAPWPAARA